MLIYIYDATLQKLKELLAKGYVTKDAYETLMEEQHAHIRSVFAELKILSDDPKILEKVVRLYAIGIERRAIRKLYATHEVNERVIRLVMAKLEYQTDAIERNIFDARTHEHGTSRDVFEILAGYLHALSPRRLSAETRSIDEYLYYRSLAIISRKVLKELHRLNTCFEEAFEAPHSAVHEITAVYETFREGSTRKLKEIYSMNPELFEGLDATLTRHALYAVETDILEQLKDRAMVTPKVSIALAERFEEEHVGSKILC
jgi:hypothetical protein